MKKIILIIIFLIIFTGCTNDKQIILQPNITIIMPPQDKIINNDEVKISATISSEFLERNDIQYYNTDKQDYCIKQFENNTNIKIINLYGISMNPTIGANNKLICDKSIKDYENGMIITFKNWENKNTTHRIKAVYPDYVITQGDNNVADDGKINKDKIEGVVIGVCY